MKLNLKSLFASGVVAGLVIIIIGAGLVPLIGEQMDEVLRSRLLPPLGVGAMIFFTLLSIIFGIGAVGLYVLLLNVIKSKMRAVLTAAVLFWFFKYFLSNAALVAYGFMPLGLTIIGTVWGLLELVLGVLAGSKIYKEA